MPLNSHSGEAIWEPTALPSALDEEVYAPAQIAAYNAAVAAAYAASTKGNVLNADDLSCYNQILYPSPCVRSSYSCFFTTCCILSAGSTVIGCGILSLGSAIPTPTIMKAVFAPPAFFGWIASTTVATLATIRYRYELAPEQEEGGQESVTPRLGSRVGYLQASDLFQRADNHSSIMIEDAEGAEREAVIVEDDRIKPPPGYAPPPIPQIMN